MNKVIRSICKLGFFVAMLAGAVVYTAPTHADELSSDRYNSQRDFLVELHFKHQLKEMTRVEGFWLGALALEHGLDTFNPEIADDWKSLDLRVADKAGHSALRVSSAR